MKSMSSSRWFAYSALAWLSTLVIFALSALLIVVERSAGYQSAEVSVLNTARVLSNEVENKLDHVNALLVTVGKRYIRAAQSGSPEVELLAVQVKEEIPSFPLVVRLGITDDEGLVTFNTDYSKYPTERPDLSERDYFQRARAGEKELMFAGPLLAKLTGEWALVLGRRLEDARGNFLGVIFAVLPVESIGGDFSRLDLGPAGIVNLRTLDFSQVARYPVVQGAGAETGNRNVSRTIADLMRESPGKDHYTYTTVAPIDGVERVYAYQKLSHSPYWMTVGLATGDFLLQWRHTASALLLLSLLISAILFWGARILNRQHHSLEQKIVEKQTIEESLKESETRAKAMLNAVPDLIFRVDRHGRFLDYKARSEHLADHAEAPVVGTLIRDSMPPELAGAIEENIHTTLETGQLQTFEYEFSAPGGGARAYEARMLPSGAEQVIAVVRDISERKEIESELLRHRQNLEDQVQRRTADLVEAHKKLEETQFAMNSVGIGITWADIETGRFLYANRFAAEFLDYAENEMLQLGVSDIDPSFPSEAFARLCDTIRRKGYVQFESTQKTRSGQFKPVEMTIFYHSGSLQSAPRLIAFMTDISGRKETEQALVQAKKAAEVANVAKSAFLANMSHEIRTPLNAVIGMVHVLRRSGVRPDQKQRLDTIENAGNHLVEVINSILDLSKIEAGRFSLEETGVNLESLLANVTSILKEQVEQKGLGWHTEAWQLPENVLGDPTRLQQALLNYATNAVKFTESGDITLRVKLVKEDQESALVHFEVEDTGIGLAADALARLFISFEQADASTTRKYGGSGLGLAIARKLAESMGGEAGARSAPGIGSVFWFTARLKKGQLPTGRFSASRQEGADVILRRDFPGARILIAEDEPINREVALMLLDDVGITADFAEDGDEAVKRATQNDYALILMDMQMPGMDGVDATRHIRQLPGRQKTPIIAMTANAFADDKARCLAAGMNAFLTKPVNPEALYAVLLSWLRL